MTKIQKGKSFGICILIFEFVSGTVVLGILSRSVCIRDLRELSLQLLSTTVDILAQPGFSTFRISLELLNQQTAASYNRGERSFQIVNKRA